MTSRWAVYESTIQVHWLRTTLIDFGRCWTSTPIASSRLNDREESTLISKSEKLIVNFLDLIEIAVKNIIPLHSRIN